MSARCSAKQVSELIMIWSSHNGPKPVLCQEFEDIENLKCLDIFLSTLVVFSDAFSSEIDESFYELLEELSLSKKSFIKYLKPRALILAEKKGYFDFMLICAYFSRIVKYRALSRNCFHLARVVCKLLTRILEDGFREIFETDSGWENLISYCRNIHSDVFPSKKNRPFDFETYPKMGSDKEEVSRDIDGIVSAKRAKIINEIDENKICEQKIIQDRIISDPMFLTEKLGLMPGKEESSLEDYAIDSESVTDDTTYWKYFDLDRITICERITHSVAHLKDVYNLLGTLKENIDATCIPVNKYDISVSDDEYIEQLKEEANDLLSFNVREIAFSDETREFYANRICEEENERLGATSWQDQVRTEDITHDQLLEYVLKGLVRDGTKCQLCNGKMDAFIENWFESFSKEYSNSNIVTVLSVYQ